MKLSQSKLFTPEQKIQRAFLRLATHLFELWEEDPSGKNVHTRIFESPVIHDFHVLHGESVKGNTHREHVVPCAWLRDHCINLFNEGTSIVEVAIELRRLLVIVRISKDEAKALNLKFKTKMPDGWSHKTDSVFVRLELAGVKWKKCL